MAKVNAGLSQNPLNHSFMSASLFNAIQRRFSHEETFVCSGKASYAAISKKRLKKIVFKCAGGKSCANDDCVGMFSLGFEK